MSARWVKSSFSFSNGNCVEVAELPGDTVGIRDSRDPGGPVLRFTRAEWAAFLCDRRRHLHAGDRGDLVPLGQGGETGPLPDSGMVATCRSCRTPRS